MRIFKSTPKQEKGGKMTIKRKLLKGATVSVFALALTIPMTFAACPVASSDDCGCTQKEEIVTPDNATCSKCKKSDCACQKKRKHDKCAPCEEKKSDCGCPTGGAAPCIESKPLNEQSYAYPNAIYSNANQAYIGEEKNIPADNRTGKTHITPLIICTANIVLFSSFLIMYLLKLLLP